MTSREVIKQILFLVLGSGLRTRLRINKIRNKKLITILNLHRVHENDFSAYKPLNPKVFIQLIEFIKSNYLVTSFSELSNLETSASTKPLLILSFDDGYKDFINVTCPILDKYQIRANQNIIPECVMSGIPPLNVALQDFIGKATPAELKYLSIPNFSYEGDLSDLSKLGFQVSKFIKNKSMREQTSYRDILFKQIENLEAFNLTKMMDLDDLKQIANNHDIGAHSFSHANLGIESDDYVVKDFAKCKAWFKEHLNQDVDIYAFPNGSYKEHHIQLAFDNGYKHLLLVNDQFVKNNGSVYERFGFDASSLSEARFKTTGRFIRL